VKKLNVFVGAGVFAAAASAALLGAGGAAAAPDVAGQTYGDAKQTIQQTGATAVVATKTGSLASLDECIVTNAWSKPQVDNPRGGSDTKQVLVALNCNGAVASAGAPGNSAASPEGRQALASADDAG
jgi:hypothetical protein